MNVTLYLKPDCHLCEDALATLRSLSKRYRIDVETVDISQTPQLTSTYRLRIPVVRIGAREFDAPLTRQSLERALSEASTHT